MKYDLNYVFENREMLLKSMKKRGVEYPVKRIIELYNNIKKLRREVDIARHQRNEISGNFKNQTKEDKEQARKLRDEIDDKEKGISDLEKEAEDLFLRMPNILDESVPVGKDDTENVELKKWGTVKRLDFKPKGHEELAVANGLLDVERAAKVSGSRFYFLKGKLVLLDMALQRYVMDKLTKKGYVPVLPPFMIKRAAYEGVTSLQDFEDVLYKVSGKEDTGEEERYMIATSEHPIAAMHMNEDIPEDKLPLKYAGISQCFRREAGAHGKDTKGIFRVHQFSKVEQFVFCRPEDSEKFHAELLQNAEEIYQELSLPYRVVNICTGDIGIVAHKKYDIEGYMYSQGRYRELVSCSNCTDWQSRRLNVRTVDRNGDKRFVHTLNSTAISQRPLVAILEAYQQKNGKIKVPEVLVEYTGFTEL